MISSRHFREVEFERCTPSCSLQDMEQGAMDMFDRVRDMVGMSLILNCAYRTREWDRARGRSGNSAHTEGRAIDIHCTDITTRYKIISAALEVGITRIGIAKNFIHLDTSELNTPRVVWLY